MAAAQKYPLCNDYLATTRLNLQHFIFKACTGYLIHPSIQSQLPSSPRIADVGTGTGVWLLDLASDMPVRGQFDGLDVDLSQCPPQEWLPPRMQMHQWNCFDEVPEHLVGVYDLIHVRYFICVVRDNDPTPLLRSFSRMLKPGGYIQWSEIDLSSIKIARAQSKPYSVPHTQTLLEYVAGPKPEWRAESQIWTATLGKTFSASGLVEVQQENISRKPWTLPMLQDLTLMLAKEFIGADSASDQTNNTALPSENKLESDRAAMVNMAASEQLMHGRGVAISTDIITTVGKKPHAPRVTSKL